MAALASAIGRGALTSLESLDLSDNPIGKEGVALLSAPLRALPKLQGLTAVINCSTLAACARASVALRIS